MTDREYNQRSGESYIEWRNRLLLDKASGSSTLSWTDIKLLLNIDRDTESLEAIAQGMWLNEQFRQERLEEAYENQRNCDKFDELESKAFELDRKKKQMQDQKRELNKISREWARAENIKHEVMEAVRDAAEENRIYYDAPETNIHSGKDGILLLSDWHLGQNTMNSVNVYNIAEFNKRIQKLMEATIEYGRMHQIEALHVFCLGDLINGLIHVTTRISNDVNVIQQTKMAAQTLSDMLMQLAEEFPHVYVHFTRGNHERVSANIKESVAGESFFDVMPWYVQAKVEGHSNITIVENEIDPEIASAKIRGHLCYAVHGHRDKPMKVTSNLTQLTKQIPEYIFMGHFHANKEEDINGIEVIVNGSLCGTDEYAMSLRRTSKISQKFIIFDDEGRLCTYNIRLT